VIVIVGGGVTGLATAFWLTRAGHPVTLLERGVVGWEASGRNGGGCTHAYSPLFREEQRLWPMMDELLGAPTEWRPWRVKVALDEGQLERFRASTRLATAQGFAAEELDAKQLRELVPWVGDGAVGGLLWRFGGHANPQRTVQAYAWAVERQGGRILQHTPALGLVLRGGRAVAVRVPGGEIGCEAVLLAAGPHTARLAEGFGVRLPTAAARVEMFVTEPLPPLPHGGVDGNGLYGRQSLRGNLVYGGGPHAWLDLDGEAAPPAPSGRLLGSMARRLHEMFPRLGHLRVIRSWAGVVENTPDGRPVLERIEDPANVTVATMSSVGFGLSPAVGRALAGLVTEGRCDFADLSALGLGRFANLPQDWRERQGWLA
jgi:sarcosine oxidase subunit beta